MTAFARGVALLVTALALLGSAASSLAQEVTPRRGFSVKLVEPESGAIVQGRTRIRAEVASRKPEDVARVEFYVDDKLVFSDTEPPWQVVHDFGDRPGVHVTRVVARHREGVTVSDFVITRSLEPQYVVNVQRVLLDVSVRDRDKRLVKGLRIGDFEVYEGKKRQELLSVGVDDRPLLVGILLDSSGSMRGERIEQAQEAACRFVQTLRPEDRAFVIDFDEQVFLVQKATSDHDELCTTIRSTASIGGTAIHDAIHAAYRVIYETESDRRALVVLTDGDDANSTVTFDELMLEAQLSEVAVYSIGLDVGALSSGRSSLSSLAKATGGRAYFVRKADELAGTYEAIAEELRSIYQIVYRSDNETMDGRFIDVEVKLTRPGKHDLSHRKGYYALDPADDPTN